MTNDTNNTHFTIFISTPIKAQNAQRLLINLCILLFSLEKKLLFDSYLHNNNFVITNVSLITHLINLMQHYDVKCQCVRYK